MCAVVDDTKIGGELVKMEGKEKFDDGGSRRFLLGTQFLNREALVTAVERGQHGVGTLLVVAADKGQHLDSSRVNRGALEPRRTGLLSPKQELKIDGGVAAYKSSFCAAGKNRCPLL